MERPKLEILGTYPDFGDYWKLASTKSLNMQIKLWQDTYVEKYSELFAKQVRCCQEAEVRRLDVARKVFPFLPRRLHSIQAGEKP